ncbi:MAG: helix-turn-helix transcriptional regulator [Ignavibacteria bacterium]|jgi:AraC-like DNA-binding protein|nr:helix-turn-helix transcriptional regulator [Ignavibacteria bacterium]MCU7498648.1 helix-turn-helix transcriptional regulator [Ignavibacteria bacterium]MCU7512603.1 helix-turn-helix transcriptional regulator [Ignavibacteria bacterium]MCU7519198.1 helix-turn-helix transcriptional regulator [Ignavibacteria bacterium]MCU7524381.1 helix-turn-helix transcriptional regulator [Ignavibacteria bacterium]
MHFKKISDLFEYQGVPAPENPLLGLVQFNEASEAMKNKEVSYDFYTICFKKIESGEFWYGKTKYDSDKGLMYFLKPGQVLNIYDVEIKEKGFSIYFHEDYLMGHSLFKEIRKYNFFDYEINEALHLSPREKEVMWSLYHKIEAEYHNNPDEFSKPIILSHLDSMLKYAQRFYKRQFIDRKPLSGSTITKFNEYLVGYFETREAAEKGLPTVNQMALQLNLSPKYLSDLLKQETGKTAMELIHLFVISEAKNMIVSGEKSISEIAYQLGFDNPPYFSRLFKKEVGLSPKEYKNQIMN